MIYLLLASFLWGTSFVAGIYALKTFDPYMIVQLRMFTAAICVLPSIFKRKEDFKKILKKDALILLFISFLISPLTFFLQTLGLKYTNSSSATAMIGAEPFIIVFVGHFLFKVKATLYDWLFGGLVFIGILLVVYSSNQNSEVNLLGCLLVIISSIVVAFWVLISKSLLKRIDHNLFTAITLFFGALMCIPFSFTFSNFSSFKSDYLIESSFAVIYLGIGCSFLASKFWNIGLKNNTANNSGIFLALEAIFGVILSVFLLNETIQGINFIGILLVLGTTMFSQLIKLKK